MADLLIDTDVFVDHLRGARRLTGGRDRMSYSVITRAELLAGADDRRLITGLLASLTEHPVDRAVAERGSALRRLRGLRLPDALIAATALEHRLTLVTRKTRDFTGIRGLTVRVPTAR